MTREPVNPSVIRVLLDTTVPEHQDQLDVLWTEINPQFYLLEDTAALCFHAKGADIEFSNSTMRLFWLLGFSAWRAFRCYSPAIFLGAATDQSIGSLISQDDGFAKAEGAFKLLMLAANAMQGTLLAEDLQWPSDVPEPQVDKSNIPDPQDQAAFDLTMIATAYAVLHELRHVWHYRQPSRSADWTEEEIACDVFARDFIMAKAGAYAKASSHPYEEVVSKRAKGIALGAFVVYELTPAHGRGGTSTHPPFADRLEALIHNMPLKPDSDFWVFAGTLLMGALRSRSKVVQAVHDTPEALTLQLINEIRQAG